MTGILLTCALIGMLLVGTGMGWNLAGGRADISIRVMQFEPIVEQMKDRYQVRIRKWRRTMSGCAWRVYYTDGRTINWIESPFPRTPISLAIFLHEVGHHAIGFDTYRKRCEEEYYAWRWALERMERLGITPDQRVHTRVERSMQYAVGKAVRRGIRSLPEPLMKYLPQAA